MNNHFINESCTVQTAELATLYFYSLMFIPIFYIKSTIKINKYAWNKIKQIEKLCTQKQYNEQKSTVVPGDKTRTNANAKKRRQRCT